MNDAQLIPNEKTICVCNSNSNVGLSENSPISQESSDYGHEINSLQVEIQFRAIHFLKACSLIVNSIVNEIHRMTCCCNF
jgi:hypothetical protein